MKSSIVFVLLALIGASSSAYAERGGAGSHGGDMLVSEFTGSARLIAGEIARQGNPGSCPASASFLKAVDETAVTSQLRIVVDGVERDASNNAETKTIVISRSRLINTQDPLNYLTLVMHEYLGILGIEGTNEFHRSQGCIQQLQILGTELTRLRYRVNPLAGTIEKFVKGEVDLRCKFGVRAGNKFDIEYYPSVFGYEYPIEKPTRADFKETYFFEKTEYPNGRIGVESVTGYGLATYASRLKQWNVRYRVETGLTEISMIVNRAQYTLNYHGPVTEFQREINGTKLIYLSDGGFRAERVFVDRSISSYATADCTLIMVTTYGN